MSSGISLIGPGMVGNYQLCTLTYQATFSLTGKFYPTLGTFLLNVATGELIPASQMPFKYRPGFLFQGRKDLYGETNVLHGKVVGECIPPEASTAFGATFGSILGTQNTGFKVVNDADLTKNRIYTPLLSTYSKYASYLQHYSVGNLYCNDVMNSTGSRSVRSDINCIRFVWVFENLYYKDTLVITITGNLLHYKMGALDKAPHFNQGRWSRETLTKSNMTISRASSSTSAGIQINCFTPPSTLSGISGHVVLASIQSKDEGRINTDLMSLSELPDNNTSFLSCYDAVESMKYMSFAWLEYLKDTYEWKKLIPPLRKFKQLAKPAIWAQLFLWYTYGIKPTISSVSDLVELFVQHGGNDPRSLIANYSSKKTRYGTKYDKNNVFRGSYVSLKTNAKLTLSTALQPESRLSAFILFLDSLDFGMTATDLWELVTLSFVVDWFANTSDLMKWADYTSYPNKYDLDNCVLSHKNVVTLPASLYFGPSTTGVVELSMYNRVTQNTFPSRPFELNFTDPRSHWLEGSALLIAKAFG